MSVSLDPNLGDDLTSLSLVKYHAGIDQSVTTFDTPLSLFITAASRLTEKYCDRLFISTSRTEYADGKGWGINGFIEVQAYPISSVDSIGVAADGLWIGNNSTSVQQARASLSPTTLTLTRVTSGTTASSSLTLSGYSTIGALVTAINALGNGWIASTTYTSWGVASLIESSGAKSAKPPGGAVFQVFDDSLIDDFDWGDATDTIWGDFPPGVRNVRIAYTGGYGTLPDDLQNAVAMVTASMYQRSLRDQTLKSETVGDWKWTAADGVDGSGIASIPVAAQELLAAYKRPSVSFAVSI